MISVDEANKILKSTEFSFGIEEIPISKGAGRILAKDIEASSDLPPFNRVMMDGIAVRFDEVAIGKPFRVKGILGAGEQHPDHNEFLEIMTGAFMPSNLDTVIPYEHLVLVDQTFTINQPFKKGQNVHPQATDARIGDCLVATESFIGPAEIATAASMGYTHLQVYKRPTCSILNTGNELVSIDQPTGPFQIRASNGIAISAAIYNFVESINSYVIHDEIHALTTSVSKALDESDVIIITGGVSAGKFDHVPVVLKELGVEILFHKVSQKPGKPMLFGKKENKVIFALPGNPVSSLMCTYAYVIPWIKMNIGFKNAFEFNVVRLKNTYSKKGSLSFYLPVCLKIEDGTLWANPIKNNGSGDFAGLTKADGWFLIPSDLNEVADEFLGKYIPFKPMV